MVAPLDSTRAKALPLLLTVVACTSADPATRELVAGGQGGVGTGGTVAGGSGRGDIGVGGSDTMSDGSAGVVSASSTGGSVEGTGGASGTSGNVGGRGATGGAGNGGGSGTTGGLSGTGGSVGGTGAAAGGDTGGVSAGGAGGTGSTAGGVSGTGGSVSGGGTGGGSVVEECVVPTDTPGTPTVFNDDGSWIWFQDERAIVDPEANLLIFSSVAVDSAERYGDVEASIYDLDAGGVPQRSMLGNLLADEYNAAALLKLGSGQYLAMYTGHNVDCYSYYNIYDAGSWGAQNLFDWGPHGCPTDVGRTVTFSNLWHIDGEIYNFAKAMETSPHFMVSSDGSSWSYGGRLTSTPTVGYVAGYYKYWGNNVDRIDFVGTEAHPRDNNNSLYHGYIQGGKSYDSFGQVVDEDIRDEDAPEIEAFTRVFAADSELGSVTLRHLWHHDLVRYDDGTIVLLFQGRADNNADDPDERFGYARFDGTDWSSTYLVRGGRKLLDSEQDYTGLAAIHPNSPHTIYLSTTTDPRDDSTALQRHEIWRGTTCDQGTTFTWTPITEDSTYDNLRPVVPYWNSSRTVLLWMRGSYVSISTHDTEIVGHVLDGR